MYEDRSRLIRCHDTVHHHEAWDQPYVVGVLARTVQTEIGIANLQLELQKFGLTVKTLLHETLFCAVRSTGWRNGGKSSLNK